MQINKTNIDIIKAKKIINEEKSKLENNTTQIHLLKIIFIGNQLIKLIHAISSISKWVELYYRIKYLKSMIKKCQ